MEVLIILQLFFRIGKDKKKTRAAGDPEIQRTERTPRKCFRCGSLYHLIAKCPKPPKDNEKRRNQVSFDERGNHALQKESDNGDNDKNKKIHSYMARMSGNGKSSSRDLGDIS